jgi:hypothetical protein
MGSSQQKMHFTTIKIDDFLFTALKNPEIITPK